MVGRMSNLATKFEDPMTIRSRSRVIIVKKTKQFKTSSKGNCGRITQLKHQISKSRSYLAAYRRVVYVLTSNSAFLIFAVEELTTQTPFLVFR